MTDEAEQATYDPTKYVLVPIAQEEEKEQAYDPVKFGEYKFLKDYSLPCHAGVCSPKKHKKDEIIVLAHKVAKYYLDNAILQKVE